MTPRRHDDGYDEDETGFERAAVVICPSCGEAVELTLDPDGGALQEYVEDCAVCCRPWRVRVRYDARGRPAVDVEET